VPSRTFISATPFNEIKSDITGTLTRIVAETGSLVKQKQPLIEVEPS
jgi:biotin carboxyl carrier protein